MSSTYTIAQNLGYLSWYNYSATGNPDPPYTVFEHDYSGNLIYYSNGTERFGTPFDIAAGVEETSLQPDILVYPDPVADKFKLSTKSLIESAVLSLLNLVGQKVYEAPVSRTETNHDISALPAGLYLWRIESDHGTIQSGKIVKQ
ncbi:MAG: T9SS type A sorting domain-containing protein [Bacteroidetes bacterium]|nr:T9SS type A sorting domain-containing protein [Bacteroidota bacterium]